MRSLPINSRRIAAQIITTVTVHKRSLTKALESELANIPKKKDRAFIQALCFGVLRWYFRLCYVLDLLLQRPLKSKDEDIRILALLGLYQLAYTRVKPYAAVAETVAGASKKSWAKAVLNGLLRTYQRNQADLDERADQDLVARSAHPQWLLDRLAEDWPKQLNQIVIANNTQAPMVLRVNLSRIDRQSYLQDLFTNDISAQPLQVCASGIRLDQPIDVENLPGFNEGRVSVQDGAAQLAAFILDAQANHRVLDACAAPGGKTLHILEHCPNIAELIAMDIDELRLKRVRENLDRNQFDATLLAEDVSNPSNWWDGRLFDKILLDAPCSGTGVIRRHPDIKLLRRSSDVGSLVKLQKNILNALWPMLKPGGTLLYATCSILKRENEQQIMDFLDSQTDAEESVIKAHWGIPQKCGRQILPGEFDMDGFFYARLKKRA